MTDQKTSDNSPYTLGGSRHGVRILGVENCLDRVDRASADVAEHDAEGAHSSPTPAQAAWVRRSHSGIVWHGPTLTAHPHDRNILRPLLVKISSVTNAARH